MDYAIDEQSLCLLGYTFLYHLDGPGTFAAWQPGGQLRLDLVDD